MTRACHALVTGFFLHSFFLYRNDNIQSISLIDQTLTLSLAKKIFEYGQNSKKLNVKMELNLDFQARRYVPQRCC